MNTNERHRWQKLFTLAKAFYDLGPWEWIYDNHTFSVSSNIDKQIYFCSLMGNNKEVFGINFYPGEKGLTSLQSLYHTTEGQQSPPLAGFEQLCYHLEFEHESEMLQPEQHALYETLGFDWKKEGYGIVLNDMQPGLAPQMVTSVEAELVAELLQQALDFGKAYQGKTSYLEQLNSLSTMIAVQMNGENVDFEIVDRPDTISKWETKSLPALTLRSIGKLPKRSATNIMMAFYAPGLITDAAFDRPFFSLIAIWMDAETGQIVSMTTEHPDELRPRIPQWMAEQFSQQGYRPTRIAVNEAVVAQSILPLCKEWEIDILLTPPHVLDDLYFMMMDFMEGDLDKEPE